MIYDHDGNPVDPADVLDDQELADYYEARRNRPRRNWRADLPTPRPIVDPWPVERDDDWTPALAAAVAKLRRIAGDQP